MKIFPGDLPDSASRQRWSDQELAWLVYEETKYDL